MHQQPASFEMVAVHCDYSLPYRIWAGCFMLITACKYCCIGALCNHWKYKEITQHHSSECISLGQEHVLYGWQAFYFYLFIFIFNPGAPLAVSFRERTSIPVLSPLKVLCCKLSRESFWKFSKHKSVSYDTSRTRQIATPHFAISMIDLRGS